MSQTIITNGMTGLNARNAINSNFSELYSSGGGGGAGLPARWFRVSDYGAVRYSSQSAALAGTDSASAIQACINSCYAAGGGTVEFFPGYYKVAGAVGSGLVGDQYSRAQIRLPFNLWSNPVVVIRLYCHEPAPTLTAGSTQGGGGATLVSTLTGQVFTSGGVSAVPSVLSGPSWVGTHTLAGGSGNGQFTALYLEIDGIAIRTQSNPTLTAFDLSGVFAGSCKNYRADTIDAPGADTAYPPTHITQPTHAHAAGMICPQNNNNCINNFGTAHIMGYYCAFVSGENTHQEGILSLFSNWQCIGMYFTYHPCNLGPRISAYGNHIILAGWYPDVGTYDLPANVFDIYIDIEDHTAGWPVPDTSWGHIKDGANAARGIFRYNHVTSGTGYTPLAPFYMTGGAGIKLQEMSLARVNPTDLLSIGASSRLLSTFDVGGELIFTSSSATTLSVETNAVVPMPFGATAELFQYGTGQVSVAPASGVTLLSSGTKRKLVGQYSWARLRKVDTNTWTLVGDITT